MIAKEPMGFTRTLLDHWMADGAPDVGGRVACLERLHDAFKGIPASVLDRIARVVVREVPSCDAVLQKFAAHVHHRDDGIGDLLVVACAVVSNAEVRNEMCALYERTAALAMEARSEGRHDFDGLGRVAMRTISAVNPPAAVAA